MVKKDAYYVVNGLGSTIHMDNSHINPEDDIFPSHVMEKNVVLDLVKPNANLGIITNVMFRRSGKMYRR